MSNTTLFNLLLNLAIALSCVASDRQDNCVTLKKIIIVQMIDVSSLNISESINLLRRAQRRKTNRA